MELGLKFIVRLTELRHYYPKGYDLQTFTRQEIIAKYTQIKTRTFLDIRIKKRLTKKCFIIRAAQVELTNKSIDSENSLWLIRAWASDALTLYLLTDIQDINEESLVFIMQIYLNRWKIEEFIRFVKQEYHAESFLVRDLGRIRNLFNILFISLVVLTRLSEFHLNFSRLRSTFIRYAKRMFKLPPKNEIFPLFHC
jgi:IS4 transposase